MSQSEIDDEFDARLFTLIEKLLAIKRPEPERARQILALLVVYLTFSSSAYKCTLYRPSLHTRTRFDSIRFR